MLNFGQQPHMGFEPRKETHVESVDIFVSGMKRAREDAESALKKAAEDMKKYYDAHRRDTPQYKIGDKVWLESDNVQTGRPTCKLDHKRLGPYPITKVLSNNAYELKLPKSMKIHLVFNVVKLRTYEPPTLANPIIAPPPPLSSMMTE